MADTINKKPALLILIFGATCTAIALYSAVIYYYVDMQINDDRRINIIGRQAHADAEDYEKTSSCTGMRKSEKSRY